MNHVRTPRFANGRLFHLLARASHLLATQITPLLNRAGLNYTDWRVLTALDEGGPAPRLSELADLCGMQQPTTTKSIDALAANGFVLRTVDPSDRRAVQLFLTGSGRDFAAKLRRESSKVEAAVLKKLVASGDAARLKAIFQQAVLAAEMTR